MLLPNVYPVTCHTKHVGKGSTFVAIKGHSIDGASFIPEAIEKGATKIVVSRDAVIPSRVPSGIEICRVEDTRKALALFARQAHGFPDEKLKIIGLTGTAGKTTTTQLIRHILQFAGYKTALIGGVSNYILDESEPSVLTSQSSDYFYTFLNLCVQRGVTHVVMEVSSHALTMDRVYGVQFAAVGFTNLAPEHLDYHKTIEEYFRAKLQIFNMLSPDGVVVVNKDDHWGNKAYEHGNGMYVGMGRDHENFDQFACPVLMGEFSRYNVSMAATICERLGVATKTISQALATFDGVPGRMQLHTLKNGAKAFVDFAHKPSAMEVVLKTLRPLTNHLIVVFGCGGNRDRTKRPVMGDLAAQFADQVIITNDNPRFEDPDFIISEIFEGIPEDKRAHVIIQKNRAFAIKNAVELTKNGSIVAILGKGHETFYEVKGERTYFNDYAEVSQY